MALLEKIEVKVLVGNLKSGMYVCRLDRPWLETPYKLQGFTLDSEEAIEQLASHCEYVFIDDSRSIYSGKRVRPDYSYLNRMARPEALARLDRIGFRYMRGPDRPTLIPIDYPDPIPLHKEIVRARNAWKQARMVVSQCIARAKAGKLLSVDDIDSAIEPILESVVRGPDASMWLAAQRKNEPYTITHPLNCCALILGFARFLGFPPEVLLSMAKAALLHNIGMWLLGQNYYIKREVADEETRITIEEHVLNGLEYLDKCGLVDLDTVLAICHHHERFDGAGYPRRVRGPKVSLMGYMLQIVGTFDALCNKRSYQSEHSVQEAHRILYAERDQAFPAEVLELFFQSLGVYPTGSFVELSNGEMAAVSGQVATSRVYPMLIRLTFPDGSPRQDFAEIAAAELIKMSPPVKIVRSMPPGSVDIRLLDIIERRGEAV